MSGWIIALIVVVGLLFIALFLYVCSSEAIYGNSDDLENYKNKIQEFKINTIKVDNNFNEVKELELVKKVEDSLIKKDIVKVNTLNLLIYSGKVLSNKQSYVGGNENLGDNDFNFIKSLLGDQYGQLLFKRDWYVVSICELPEDYEDILKRKKDEAISKINTMSKKGELSLMACEKIYSNLENSITSIIKNRQYYYHKPTGLILEVNYDL